MEKTDFLSYTDLFTKFIVGVIPENSKWKKLAIAAQNLVTEAVVFYIKENGGNYDPATPAPVVAKV